MDLNIDHIQVHILWITIKYFLLKNLLLKSKFQKNSKKEIFQIKHMYVFIFGKFLWKENCLNFERFSKKKKKLKFSKII